MKGNPEMKIVSGILTMYMLTLAFVASAFGSFQLNEQDYAKTAIVLPEDTDSAKQFATQELQKHHRALEVVVFRRRNHCIFKTVC